jgi:hypothetical protein
MTLVELQTRLSRDTHSGSNGYKNEHLHKAYQNSADLIPCTGMILFHQKKSIVRDLFVFAQSSQTW